MPAISAKVSGIDNVNRALDNLAQKTQNELVGAGQPYAVIIGYAQSYASYVHENLSAKHKPGKQAKFLEGPARQLANSGELALIGKQTYDRTKSLRQSLLAMGLRILRESQLVVPVDTGALKASGFCSYQVEAAEAANKALAESNALKLRALARRR